MIFSDAYDLFIADCKNKGYSNTTMDNLEFIYRLEYQRFENIKLNKIRDVKGNIRM